MSTARPVRLRTPTACAEAIAVAQALAKATFLFTFFMAFYVYIIQSQYDNSFYKGFTENPAKRLRQHNDAECTYTSTKIPWKLVYVEECFDKTTALKRERALKKYSHQQIIGLISSSKNIVNRFGEVG